MLGLISRLTQVEDLKSKKINNENPKDDPEDCIYIKVYL